MWEPIASLDTLRERAEIMRGIRAFFASRSVLEVDVPVVSEYSVTDPHLEALAVDVNCSTHYLQTSPEYFMKRLIAAGSGDIYYLGKAFRDEESARFHHREFTMLEWYRLGFSEMNMMREVADFVQKLKPSISVHFISYREAFEQNVGVNPHEADVQELCALSKHKLDISFQANDINTWLDLLFSHCVEPKLPKGLVFVHDFPKSQAALARLHDTGLGYQAARRFEAFIDGVELANGYYELSDCNELKRRFQEDNIIRDRLGKSRVDLDAHFVSAMEHGLPECSGVALGVDRLMMNLLGVGSIADQRSF